MTRTATALQIASAPDPGGSVRGLQRERVEEQIRRASRWDLPRSMRAYPMGPRLSEFGDIPTVIQTRESTSTGRIPGLVSGVISGTVFNGAIIAALLLFPAPLPDAYEEPTLRLVIAEARASQPLEELAVDIRTSLGREPVWDRLDQAIGLPIQQIAPLAIPSVVDRFVGNPLSISPNSGGDVVVGGSEGMASRGEQYAGAKILGVRARGERFVFVLDNTVSMLGPAWKQVKREVLAGVARLGDGQRFAVVLVDGTHYPVKGSFQKDAMHVARVESAAQLAQWLDTRPLVQTPDTLAAMESAMAHHADAVYLVGATAFPVEMANAIRRGNRWVEEERLKVPGSILHAIGVAEGQAETRGLEQIATENGGHFYHVSAAGR